MNFYAPSLAVLVRYYFCVQVEQKVGVPATYVFYEIFSDYLFHKPLLFCICNLANFLSIVRSYNKHTHTRL